MSIPCVLRPKTKKGNSIKEESERDESANDYSDGVSINFKNSIYSKIRGDPSVNHLPSMVTARDNPIHSESASQISALGYTNKIVGQNYRNNSLEDESDN